MRRKKMSDQHAEEKRWVFSFDFKEQSEDECLTEKKSSDHRSDVLKGFLPQGPAPVHPRNTEMSEAE